MKCMTVFEKALSCLSKQLAQPLNKEPIPHVHIIRKGADSLVMGSFPSVMPSIILRIMLQAVLEQQLCKCSVSRRKSQ
jgi:hypothetical protein